MIVDPVLTSVKKHNNGRDGEFTCHVCKEIIHYKVSQAIANCTCCEACFYEAEGDPEPLINNDDWMLCYFTMELSEKPLSIIFDGWHRLRTDL